MMCWRMMMMCWCMLLYRCAPAVPTIIANWKPKFESVRPVPYHRGKNEMTVVVVAILSLSLLSLSFSSLSLLSLSLLYSYRGGSTPEVTSYENTTTQSSHRWAMDDPADILLLRGKDEGKRRATH